MAHQMDIARLAEDPFGIAEPFWVKTVDRALIHQDARAGGVLQPFEDGRHRYIVALQRHELGQGIGHGQLAKLLQGRRQAGTNPAIAERFSQPPLMAKGSKGQQIKLWRHEQRRDVPPT